MKQAQTAIGFLFTIGVFFLVWILFLADILSEAGRQYIENNGSTGLEALFYANLNGVIFIVILIVLAAFASFGGRG